MSNADATGGNFQDWLRSTVAGMGKWISGSIGVVSAILLMVFKLVELGAEKAWNFRIYGWPEPDIGINWQRNLAEVQQDWASILVIVGTGVLAGIAAAFTASAVRQTVSNVSHHFNTTWHIMTSPPTDVVRADKDTREWVNKLSARESAEQHNKILELIDACERVTRERDELAKKVAQQEDALKRAAERLKANERVFSQFEKLSRAMQSRIDRARQRYPV